MVNLLLEGISPDPQDARADAVRDLRDKIDELGSRLDQAREEARQWHEKYEQAYMALAKLRRTLNPLYSSLQTLFGDLALVSDYGAGETVPAQPAAPVQDDRTKAVWDAWKTKLGRNCARIIDALLVHGSLTSTQISVTTGIHLSNVPKSIYVMNRAGIINKEGGKGGRFSLKRI